MPAGRFDDEIWDEHQWEAYLEDVEQKSEQLRKFIESGSSQQDMPRWVKLLRENDDELNAVDAFIEEELEMDDAYFSDEDEWEEDGAFDDFLWDESEEELFFDDFEDEDDFDEGEEWKELSEDFAQSDNGSIETLQVYIRARELAVQTLQWADGIHPKFHTNAYNDFVGDVLIIGAKLAGGYSFGFEYDLLGGNIACTKRALYAANAALVLLEDDLKGAPFLSRSRYLHLHEQLFELRNDIGIYVQELREQFYLGLE